MPRLKSANFAVTTLAAGINSSAASFVVADAAAFPDAGPFIVLVHDLTLGFAGVKEIMEVGAINKGTNTLSGVLRGREGTAAVAHNAGDRVEVIFSAGTQQELADAADLAAHIGNVDNPHGVTAAQTGAETPVGAQTKVDAHRDAVIPHRVTDPDTQTVYAWGVSIQDGQWGIFYEEVE